MLVFGQAANETFSLEQEETEELSRAAMPPRSTGAGTQNQARVTGPGSMEDAMVAAAIQRGDQVVFDRLDVADILGIWRHARGRIIRIHGHSGTVDVAFEGHAVLERYLPDLFRRVH